MKKLLEKAIENSVVRHATKHGVLVTKLNLIGRRGFPDRVFWLRGGQPLLMEFKRPGQKLSKLQAYTIKMLEDLDYDVEVVDNVAYGIELLGLEA